MKCDTFIEALSARVKVLEVTRQCEDQVTALVELNDLPEAVRFLYYDMGGYLTTMIPNDERSINKHYALYYALSMEGGKMFEGDEIAQDEKCFITVKTLISPDSLVFPSVTPLVPACVWYVREA